MLEKTVCLVSPGHLGSNPRLVKEADALAGAGYRVHVIHGVTSPADMERDVAILRKAAWSHEAVSLLMATGKQRWPRMRQKVCGWLFRMGWQTPAMASMCCHPLSSALAKTARGYIADLYIGHCLPALPAVVQAARCHQARCGFDAEDFHSSECEDQGQGHWSNRTAHVIENKYLPACDYMTAASPLIAEAYAGVYGVSPVPILNVFPLAEAVEPQPAPITPAFYWFSQTVGRGRGLEQFIDMLGGLGRQSALDLRGHCSSGYRDELTNRAAAARVKLRILPPDTPDTMVTHSAGYTAGLALELRKPLNRDLCLTNKAFTYLLAGIPVIFSRTQAQERLAEDLGEAAILIDLEAPVDKTAVRLSAWLDDATAQSAARTEALRLGRKKYNWDCEKQKVLNLISAFRLNSSV